MRFFTKEGENTLLTNLGYKCEALEGGETEWKFTKEDTKIIKGVAILLMLAHHLWAYPERLSGKLISLGMGIGYIEYLGNFGKICVSIFFFLSGYGIYKSSLNKKVDIIKRIKKLYKTYWKVFVIFIPIAFLLFRNQSGSLWHQYSSFDLTEFIKNFIGISSSYNREWWFLISYIWVLLCFPIIKSILLRGGVKRNICLIILVEILFADIFPSIVKIECLEGLKSNFFYKTFFCQTVYSTSFWMGCEFAKDSLFEKVWWEAQKNKLLNPLLDCIYIGIMIFLRNTVWGNDIDLIICPILIIVSLDLIKKGERLQSVFCNLGKHSTNMWLIHTFFCYYFIPVAKFITFPRLAIASWGLLIVVSWMAACGVDLFWNVFAQVKRYILKICVTRSSVSD